MAENGSDAAPSVAEEAAGHGASADCRPLLALAETAAPLPSPPATQQRWRCQRLVAAGASFVCLVFVYLLARPVPTSSDGVPVPPEDAIGLSEVYGGLAGVGVGAVQTIRATFGKAASEASFAKVCRMGAKERCPLASMPRREVTAVYPGNGTRCLLGEEYMFQIIPGDQDKLLLYFQGGGACWDESSTNLGTCTRAVSEIGGEGIFDIRNRQNPFANYSVVFVGYCSGDAHVGDVARSWSVPSGADVAQRGYRNARAAVDWAKANLGGAKLGSLLVAGSSAGALGAQIWAKTLLREFSYKDAAVIADSYAGVFPIFVQGWIQKASGLCQTGLLDSLMQFRCQTGTIDVQSAFEDTMRLFPRVAFANIDSKIDKVQIAFYEVIYASLIRTVDLIPPLQKFSGELAIIYRRYNMQPNWVSYMVDSSQHMYLCKDVMYATSPAGTSNLGEVAGEALSVAGLSLSGRRTVLTEWLAGFPLKPGGAVRSECCGTGISAALQPPTSTLGRLEGLLGVALAPTANMAVGLTGMGHCDLGQTDKIFKRWW